jgi:hypothetical protein
MLPLLVEGYFPSGVVETICATVYYGCPKCKYDVGIPATSYLVIYGTLSLVFLWCAFQLVDWHFMKWNIIDILKSSAVGLVVAVPGLFTLRMFYRGLKIRRKHPRIR